MAYFLMNNIILKNKPLVEAIFELRWDLQKHEKDSNIQFDPHYKLLVGQIFEKVRNNYQFHNSLPQSAIPEEMAAYIVQDQFRPKEDGWPLIQIGPGVVTLNDTDSYEWPDFNLRIQDLLHVLFDLYSESKYPLVPNKVLLRYIDALEFDYDKDNIFEFLSNKLKTKIEFQPNLFGESCAESSPTGIDCQYAFPSTKPIGSLLLRFVRGKKHDKDALIWETHVHLTGTNVPKTKDEILAWVGEAHNLTHDIFFKMIDGELYERFKG